MGQHHIRITPFLEVGTVKGLNTRSTPLLLQDADRKI